MSSIILLTSALIYFQTSLFILNFIDETVSKPYMDEIFHVPQAQEYCLGNYNEWNDKITTLPGLYLISTTVLRLISSLFKNSDPLILCSTYYLRLTNTVLSTFNFLIIYKIFFHLNSKRVENKNHSLLFSIVSAFSISLFPLNYFFQFLYYTDTGSTLFILTSYYLQLKSKHKLSTICGAIAILYRQTNVIWVGFIMSQLILTNIENLFKNSETKIKSKDEIDANTLNTITQQRNKKHSNFFDLLNKAPNVVFSKEFSLVNFLNKIYREDICGKKLIYSDILKVLDMNLLQPYLVVILTFFFFVCVNNGIVVGDRSNHEASFHLVQLFYFCSFSCAFSASSFLFSYKKFKNFSSFIFSNFKLIQLLILPIFCLIVKNFTYEHPFLLADNRHYTFYIWSKLFKRHEVIKYVLTPIYLTCCYFFYRNLTLNGKNIGWLLSFSLCIFASLVPQKLIEFRYFIIPFYIYRLNINQTTWKEILVELLLNSVLNAVTIYIFLNKSFIWPNSDETQRFMW